MKKFLPFVLLILFCAPVFAQNSNGRTQMHRVRLAAGIYTNKDIRSAINYETPGLWNKYSNGTYFLEFSFYSFPKGELALGLGFQEASLSTSTSNHLLSVNYYTVLPQYRYNWYRSKDDMVEVYSGIGLGFTFVHERYSSVSQTDDDTFPIPAMHINAVGMRFGGNFGGFIELGFGSKGFMSGGLSFRL